MAAQAPQPPARCDDRMRDGIHCDLSKGHAGQHKNTSAMPPTSFAWGKNGDRVTAASVRTLEDLKGVRVADMTADEQRMVIRAAVQKLKREVEANATEIERILAEPEGDAPEHF